MYPNNICGSYRIFCNFVKIQHTSWSLLTYLILTIKIMKRFITFALRSALLLCPALCHASTDACRSPKGTAVYEDNWESIAANYTVPEWYRDAKFGIFIHWGIYSVPAYGNEWYSRYMYQQGSNEYNHHKEVWGDQDKFGYKDFIPMFTGAEFDAEEWAELFKKAGAGYVVPVAEHHDGFAMYDSDLNPWNAVKMGPRRDVIGLLKKSLEKRGIVLGVSTHRAENAWFFNGGMKYPSDVRDTDLTIYGRRYDDQAYTDDFAKEWLDHTKELVDKYQPKIVYFDWTVNDSVLMPYFNKFMAYYYNNSVDWKQGVVVNTKQGYPTDVMVWDVERGKSGKMMKYPWQTDTFVGTKSWGYIADEVYKTPGQIVDDLVDIVSKNGNLLLNIGPKPDGTIPQPQKDILLSIGKWLDVNGEAIYGTRCWKKFGESVTETPTGSFSDNVEVPYTAQDIRFTTKGNDFYAIALEWGDDHLLIESLTPDVIADADILDIKMLGSEETLDWDKTSEGLKISFPKNRPCQYAYTFKISFDKPVGESLESEASNEVMKHGA